MESLEIKNLSLGDEEQTKGKYKFILLYIII